jgi:hypothetical protein
VLLCGKKLRRTKRNKSKQWGRVAWINTTISCW